MRIYSQNSSYAATELSRTTRALNRSLSRLATGKRIAAPSDNAADYSFAVQLTSHLRGLNQSIRSINDAVSMINTADSALESQLEIAQRMREIAVQSGNGVLSTSDRENLNNELQSLLSEFNRLSESAEFNGHSLLDGSLGTITLNLTGQDSDDWEFSLGNTSSSEVFTKTVGTGSFSQRTTLSGDAESVSFDMGDINNDGYQDYVSADGATQKFSIFLGSSEGSFTLAQSIATAIGDDAVYVRLEDFNGDGLLDLATGETGFGIRIFKGLGDGQFEFESQINDAGFSSDFVLADINDDSKMDLVYGNSNIFTVLGNGDGSFQSALTFYSGSANPRGISTGDLNGDGNLDLFYGNADTTPPRIALGNGNGTFTTPTTLGPNVGYAVDTALIDIDNDQDLDALWITSSTGTVSVFLNDGTGNFSPTTTLTTGNASMFNIEEVDINRDGLKDLLVGGVTTRLFLFLGEGAGTFGARQTIDLESGGSFSRPTLGDFNNDQVVDFITSGVSPALYLSDTAERAALSDVNVLNSSNTSQLLEILDNALTRIQDERASLGALHNRLEFALGSNLLLSENLEEARSRTEDLDIANETAELVKNQILQQAQVAVLAQANLQLQTIIALLE